MWSIKSSVIGVSGFIFGLALAYGINYKSQAILYVAQDELIKLEEERIKDLPLEKRQLFDGNVALAIHLLSSLPKAYAGNQGLVFSESKVTGEHVRSISEVIHRQIVAALQQKHAKE